MRDAVIAEVKTKDGRILQERVDTAKGSAKNPMSTEDVVRKYEILAAKVLPSERIAELKETVFRLERLGNIRELARLLVPASDR